MAEIALDRSDDRLRRLHRRRRHQPDRRGRRVRRLSRSVRLRQDDDAALHRRPGAGDVRRRPLRRQAVNDLSASERNVAMVFQFVSLYPHLKIRDNIVFPLQARGVPRAEIDRKIEWVTKIFDLGRHPRRAHPALPPGARQKVALARAVIREPTVLLLDEPLSAIDEQFREEMRWELRHLQKQLGVTTIYVTHDQREAMSLADRIVLMSDGRLCRSASPPSSSRPGRCLRRPLHRLAVDEPDHCAARRWRPAARRRPGRWSSSRTPWRRGCRPYLMQLGIRPQHVTLGKSPGEIGCFPARAVESLCDRPRTLVRFRCRRQGVQGDRASHRMCAAKTSSSASNRSTCISSPRTATGSG